MRSINPKTVIRVIEVLLALVALVLGRLPKPKPPAPPEAARLVIKLGQPIKRR